MNKEQKDILNRVKLFMNYDNKKTLNENYQLILNEQSDQNWKTKYPCVTKFPGSTPAKLTDGTTAYDINGIYYYNNGMTSMRTSYNCKSSIFQYPKNQVEGDAFRNWFYKNYTNNPVLGNVAKKMGVDKTGPYNSKQLLKAWVLYGNDYLKSGGGKLSPDEIIQKEKKENEKNFDKDMRELWGTNFSSTESKNMNDWLQKYSEYASKEIENAIYSVWGGSENGACSLKNNEFIDGQTIDMSKPSLWERLNGKYPEINTCYNLSIVSGNKGAYIPTWEHVVKAYGINQKVSVEDIINKLYEKNNSGDRSITNSPKFSTERIVANKPKNKTSFSISKETFHDIMMILEIGSAFIPGIGPILSMGFGLTDALFYSDEDPDMAGFILLMTVLPELKIFTNLFKGGKAVYNSTLNKISKGELQSLTSEEIKFVEEVKKILESNKNEASVELRKQMGKKADEIISNPNAMKQLTQEEKNALNSISKSKNIEFITFDILLGLSIPFTTKYGREILKRIFGLYEKNIGPMTEQSWELLSQKLEQVDTENMPQLISSFEENPNEFKAYVQKDDVANEINKKIKEKVKYKKNYKPSESKLTKQEMQSLLSEIPDDFQ